MLGPIDFQSYLIVALIFVQLELIFPLRSQQKILRKHWPNDLVNLLLNGVIIQFGLLLAIGAMMAAIRLSVPPAAVAWIRAQPLWLQLVEVLLVADLGFYAAHRAFHAIPFLWRFHAVHHSIEEMDWLAAYRVHPLDQILTKSASLLPVYALGFSNGAILLFALIYKWQSLAIHSNTRLGLGPFRWVLASPQFHHWHHANEPAARDKNFAGQLPFLDAIFGTLFLPPSSPAKYGTDDPVPARYDQQLFYPLRPHSRIARN
jgi:sterol desaturase/sphingolipid hydroxylase (fatty acid hydroxylase superfamily)